MSWDQLKAYLENPQIALERMKRLGPSEGDRVEAARQNIAGFEKREPTQEEIMQQVAAEDQAIEMGMGLAGTVGGTKSAAQLLKEAPASKFGKVVVKDTAPKTFGKVRTLLGR